MVFVPSGNTTLIFEAVRAMYTDVARDPGRGFHFPTGRAACDFVGYSDDDLERLPACAVESFAGVGYPFAANVMQVGDAVLDIGSGSGTDALLAARTVGNAGHVIGLDMTKAMRAKLAASVAAADAGNVRLLGGNAERLPLADASVDVVSSNGVLNLVPDKRAAFTDIFRVLRPGGRVQIADIALGRPLSGECVNDPRLWAECVVGATLEDAYVELLAEAGFTAIEVLGRLDYFSASASAETRSIARSFNACSIVLRAVKPPAPALPPPRPWPPAARRRADVPSDLPVPDAVLDGCAQNCSTLGPVMAARMRTLASGQVLELHTDDESARLGVPAWARLTGHALLATVELDDGRTRFFLRKKSVGT